ncbi:TLL1 [Branchiostoma lanceolatum]|uniref:TLL1 protein n=1 Tax=Branchiostoma lanceolatum TaxID=7740 RepID=A0A8K0EA43_BRALA|nr:TLL1 [Branchiostoma lanceolatum]
MLTVLAFVLAACGADLPVTLSYEHDVSYNNIQLNLQNRIILDPCASKDVLEGDIIVDGWTKDYYSVDYSDGGFVSRKSHRGRNAPTSNNKHHRPRKSKLRPAGAPVRSPRERRAATAVESRLWPGGVIPYVIDVGFSNESRSVIQSAMTHWQRNTCVRFRPRMHQDFDYVFFQRGRTCHVCKSDKDRLGEVSVNSNLQDSRPSAFVWCWKEFLMIYKQMRGNKWVPDFGWGDKTPPTPRQAPPLSDTPLPTGKPLDVPSCLGQGRCCSFVGRTGNGKQTLSIGPGCDICCSFVGRTGNGKQTLSVGPGCDMFGIVLCCSFVGRTGNGKQTLSVGPGCDMFGIVLCCSFVGRTGNGKQTLSVGPGCDMFGIVLCCSFVGRTGNGKQTLSIGPGCDICCSFVGRTGNGKQTLSIGPGCDMFGIVLHEIGHLIGFWHEHSRPDRDEFVNILYDNVKDGERHNFEKLWKTQINSLGQRYDYMSIMHYGSRYFTKNGRETLSPRQSNVMIGQRTALSQMDIVQANLLYKCHRVTDCGGTIFANSGNFTSPNYPNELPSNIGCAWIVTSEEGNTLTLNVTDMDLQGVEDDGECRNEYIEIRDGMGELAPLIGRFCGNDTPTSIASSGRSLWLQLVSRGPPAPPVDGTTQYSVSRGFAVSFEPGGVCERTLTDATGRIKSPSNIETSLQGIDCAWQIVVPEGYYVALTIENIQLPGYGRSDHQCHLHFVEILDGNSSDSNVINRLCHSSQGVGLISSGSHLRIILKSSPSLQHASFSASYTSIDIDECMSDNGGCQEACLNLDGGYACGCSYGYEIAPDGTSCVDVDECLTSDNNGGCSHLCVNTQGGYHCDCPQGFTLAHNKSTCYDNNECAEVHLIQCEHRCLNTVGATGAHATPEIPGCGGNLTDLEAAFKSPELPVENPYDLDCIWEIIVEEDLQLSLRIALEPWEDNDVCREFVSLRQGSSPDSRELRLCNTADAPAMYRTHSNIITVRFRSSPPHTGGFRVEYFTTEKKHPCGGLVTGGKAILQSPGFPDYYPNRVDCVWRIVNRRGRHVRLKFRAFEVENQEDCTFDYLAIMETSRQSHRLIGRFCGSKLPPTIVTSEGDELWVKFQSDGTVQRRGFSAVVEVE